LKTKSDKLILETPAINAFNCSGFLLFVKNHSPFQLFSSGINLVIALLM